MKENGGCDSSRLFKALAVLAAFGVILVVLSSLEAGSLFQVADATEAGSIGSAGEALLTGASAEEVLAEQGLLPIEEDDVPSWFAAEVLAGKDCVGGYATEKWTVVGLTREGAAADAFDALTQDLADRGWVVHESGVANAATFTKEKGEVRWMMMQCTEVGDSTSVVLQLSRLNS